MLAKEAILAVALQYFVLLWLQLNMILFTDTVTMMIIKMVVMETVVLTVLVLAVLVQVLVSSYLANLTVG